MKKYWCFFKIRFINGLQYRVAAWAGLSTQFAWGGLSLLMYWAFYKNGKSNFPMSFPELSNYIWMQQAFFAMFMPWYFDIDILNSITDGNISYELCRPVDLYCAWFTKNAAVRLSRTALRCVPVLLVAVLLPYPFNLTLPSSFTAGLAFLVSVLLGCSVLVAFTMLVYISAFYTMSSIGLRMLAASLLEFFMGVIIPIPFFPKSLQPLFNLMPFASMQNTPFLIYNGIVSSTEIFKSLLLQAVWLIALAAIGRALMKRAVKRVVVQGG